MAEERAPKRSWEDEVADRVNDWRVELESVLEKHDDPRLKMIKSEIDVQVALADLQIKSRQADWAKVLLWGAPILAFASGIIGALIGAWLKCRH